MGNSTSPKLKKLLTPKLSAEINKKFDLIHLQKHSFSYRKV